MKNPDLLPPPLRNLYDELESNRSNLPPEIVAQMLEALQKAEDKYTMAPNTLITPSVQNGPYTVQQTVPVTPATFTSQQGPSSSKIKDRVRERLEEMKTAKAPTPKPKTTVIPEVVRTLEEGQEWFSKLFLVTLPAGLKDFPVTVFKKEDWEVSICDSIPEINKDFIPDVPVLYWAVYAVEKNKRLIITGPPGTGKTSMVRFIAANTQRPYIRINGMAGLEPSDQIGGLQAKEGSTYYAYGDAAIAAKYGALLALDEPFKNPAATNMCYMTLAEADNPKLLLYGHPDFAKRHLTPDPRFRMVLCDNVKGTGDDLAKYAATEVQDSAFLNRMSINLHLDYLPAKYEEEILTRRASTGYDTTVIRKMVQLAHEIRKAWHIGQLEHPYSPRNLCEWLDAAEFCGNIAEAFARTYPYFGETDETKTVIKAFWRDVFFTTPLPA